MCWWTARTFTELTNNQCQEMNRHHQSTCQWNSRSFNSFIALKTKHLTNVSQSCRFVSCSSGKLNMDKVDTWKWKLTDDSEFSARNTRNRWMNFHLKLFIFTFARNLIKKTAKTSKVTSKLCRVFKFNFAFFLFSFVCFCFVFFN